MKSSVKTVKRINNYEVYPKNGIGQAIMYQNMSSHYRRIYNAKSRIDTGPPFSHRPIKPCLPPKSTGWNSAQNEHQSPKESRSSVSLNSTKCSRPGCGERSLPNFHPQISKTSTISKLRSLRVYHPPRKRVSMASSIPIKNEQDLSVPDIPWIQTTEQVKIPPSKGSSSDSAYTEEGEGVWSGGESRGQTPVSDTQRTLSSDNLIYVKFVRDITEEVLRKGVFTNKAIKKIFQKHIETNIQRLNLQRMQEEVEKLQLELGIPSDDSLDDSDYSINYTSSSEESRNISTTKEEEDKELLDALSQLDISYSLKEDIVNSLGLYSSSSHSSRRSTETQKHNRNNITKHTTFSPTLEVIHDVQHSKFPQSDDDSYEEMLSEGSESRPLTPLGLAW